MKKSASLLLPALFFLVVACNSDHKKETVSNYVRIIWNIKSDDRFELLKLETADTITAKDSLELLVKEYTEGAKVIPPVDSILSGFEKDDVYNSNLLKKTIVKIDSFKSIKNEATDNSFYLEYVKSLERLRDFTRSELAEIRAEKYWLKKYSADPAEVLSYKVVCQYKVRNHPPDTVSKVVNQTFYLTKDTRKILAVK
jgi:hypothetical protein